MNKVTTFKSVASRLSNGQTVLMGQVGDENAASKIYNTFAAHISSGDLKFVSLEETVNKSESFRKILSDKGSFLLSSGPKIADLDSGLSAEYVHAEVLIEQIRAGGAGKPAFFVEAEKAPKSKETKVIDGKTCALVEAVKGNVALIRALKVDKEGNTQLPIKHRDEIYLAMSADYTVVIPDEVVEIGDIDPEYVHIPGLLVNGIVTMDSLK